MKLRYLAPAILPLLAFGECGGPSVVVPLPERCHRIEGQQVQGFASADPGTYRLEHVAQLGADLPARDGALSLRAWLSRVQIGSADGTALDFVDDLALAVVAPDGTDLDAARYTAAGEVGPVVHLSPTGTDLLPGIAADGTARVVLRYTGRLPARTISLNVTACVSGEAEYALLE